MASAVNAWSRRLQVQNTAGVLPSQQIGHSRPALLTEIMDEEYARKEQRREEILAGIAGGQSAAAVAEQRAYVEVEDSAAYEQSQPQQQQQQQQQEAPSSTIADDEALARALAEQEDYAYALQLQAAFEAQDTLRQQQQPQQQQRVLSEEDSVMPKCGGSAVVAKALRAQRQQQQQQRTARKAAAKHQQTAQPPQELAQVPAREMMLVDGGQVTKHDAVTCGRRNAERLARFMDDGDVDGAGIVMPGAGGFNALREHSRREDAARARRKESSDAARSDTVLDNTTRLTLLGLLNADVVADLGGVVSSGKEANVYHALRGSATGSDGQPLCPSPECAVKVFKTMNEFRNRGVYISGDFLSQYEKARLHPRKCIQLWAQKELRNLAKMHRRGLRCPQPVGLYGHVLVMEFLGENGVASPMLRDAKLHGPSEWSRAYAETARIARDLYHECRLVHADLSEYNLLWHGSHVFVIDVAQAVSTEHENAIEFLRRDCRNLTSFFRRKGIPVLSTRQLFEFVCDLTVQPGQEDETLARMINDVQASSADDDDDGGAAFEHTYMPRTMSEMRNLEAFAEGVAAGDRDCLSNLTLVGLRPAGQKQQQQDLSDDSTDDEEPEQFVAAADVPSDDEGSCSKAL